MVTTTLQCCSVPIFRMVASQQNRAYTWWDLMQINMLNMRLNTGGRYGASSVTSHGGLGFLQIQRQHFNVLKYVDISIIIIKGYRRYLVPITVATRSKVWNVFARLDTGVVGSNSTWGLDVCVLLFCVCAVLCAGSGLATDWSSVQGVLPTV
jgi:hypothetical protein